MSIAHSGKVSMGLVSISVIERARYMACGADRLREKQARASDVTCIIGFDDKIEGCY